MTDTLAVLSERGSQQASKGRGCLEFRYGRSLERNGETCKGKSCKRYWCLQFHFKQTQQATEFCANYAFRVSGEK